MTNDQVCKIIAAYARAFGERHTEDLIAPNYRGDVRFFKLLARAVRDGKPLSVEEVSAKFGPPFDEGVVFEPRPATSASGKRGEQP